MKHVSAWWEEAGAPGENQRIHGEKMHSLSGPSANT